MSMYEISYVSLYNTSFVIMLALLPVFFLRNEVFVEFAKRFVLLVIVAVYLLGMLRTDGVDIDNYLYAYNVNPFFIPDLGYMLLSQIFHEMGFSFSLFMVFVGFVNIYAVKRVSDFFSVNFSLLFVLWFLHHVVAHDFSQLRVGLGLSFVVIGITLLSKWKKSFFYLLGVSTHLTVIVLVVLYEVSCYLQRVRSAKTRRIFLATAAVLILLLPYALSIVAMFDDRVLLYMSWGKEGYGLPVHQYNTVFFHLIIVVALLYLRKYWVANPFYRALFVLEIFGVVIFFAFQDLSIFAYRLSNVVFTLYPVLILVLIDSFGLKNLQSVNEDAQMNKFIVQLSVFWFFSIVLFLRPVSQFVLSKVVL